VFRGGEIPPSYSKMTKKDNKKQEKPKCFYCKRELSRTSICDPCEHKVRNKALNNGLIGGTILGICLLALILALSGVFQNPVEKLDIDKNKLVEYHIEKYYPEFENCTIRYVEDLKYQTVGQEMGAKIYCGISVEDRDSMIVKTKEREPTEVLEFKDNIKLKKLLKNKLSEENLIQNG